MQKRQEAHLIKLRGFDATSPVHMAAVTMRPHLHVSFLAGAQC